MKIFRKLCLLIFLVFCLMIVGVAQTSGSQNPPSATYQVQPGDTLWDLAGSRLNDPKQWQVVFDKNPFLNQPGRVFEKNGKTIVLLKQGEQLAGLSDLGVIPTPTSLDQLGVVPPVAASPTPIQIDYLDWLLPIAWIFAGLMFLLVLYWIISTLIRRRLSNPATSGPPFVTGGAQNPDGAIRGFQEIGVRAQEVSTGTNSNHRQFQVQNLVKGRGTGLISVEYKGAKSQTKYLKNEVVWRATLVFPDDHAEEHLLLDACANPLRTGGISRYIPGANFVFTPDVQENQVAEATVPVETAPVTQALGVVATQNLADSNQRRIDFNPETRSVTIYNQDGSGAVVITTPDPRVFMDNGRLLLQVGDGGTKLYLATGLTDEGVPVLNMSTGDTTVSDSRETVN